MSSSDQPPEGESREVPGFAILRMPRKRSDALEAAGERLAVEQPQTERLDADAVAARWAAIEPREVTGSPTMLTRMEGTPDLDARSGARRRRALAGGLGVAAVIGGAAMTAFGSRDVGNEPALEPAPRPSPRSLSPPVPVPLGSPNPPVEQVVAPEPEPAAVPVVVDAGMDGPTPEEQATEAFMNSYYDDFYGEEYVIGYEDPGSGDGTYVDEGSR